MPEIAQHAMLLRRNLDLPGELQLVTEKYDDGWNIVLSGNSNWLDRKVHAAGWYFLSAAEWSATSGVGKTSQSAIANALRLALQDVSEEHNAVEIRRIRSRGCVLFNLASVAIYPYQIQRHAQGIAVDHALPVPGTAYVDAAAATMQTANVADQN